MQIKSYQIDLVEEKEGGYTVLVPELPGCVSFGKTIEEAKTNAKEAIELHLDNLKAHNSLENTEVSVLTTIVQVKTSYA